MKPAQNQVREIQQKCLEGRIGVVEAVSEINDAIGGITGVLYKPGRKFTIINHDAAYCLDASACGKKQNKRLEGLAVVGYFRAKENGSRRPGELHISKQASTKHHMGGIYKILERYVA